MSEVPPRSTLLGDLRVIETYIAYDGPRLFACQTLAEQLYMALFVDDEDDWEVYIYVAISRARWRAMRTGAIPLRTIFSEPETGIVYEVRRPLLAIESKVVPRQASAISQNWLPDPQVSLRLPDLARNPLSLAAIEDEAKRTLRPFAVLELATDTPFDDFPLRSLGTLMQLVQENVEAFALDIRGTPTTTGPIPQTIVEDSELRFVALRAASVALVVSPRAVGRLFTPPLVAGALERIRQTMAATSDPHFLRDRVAELGPRSLAKYRDLLEEVTEQATGLTLHIIDEKGATSSANMDDGQLHAALQAMRTTEAQPAESLSVVGLLVGVNMRTYVFELYDEENGQKVAGKILEEARRQIRGLTIGGRYRATILREQEIAPLTGEVSVKHRLVRIASDTQ
ncbi:MAG: DUF6575 domain-containing protein [Candidatus Dormibacteria bacterium]